MVCHDVRSRISAVLDHRIDADERVALEAHLQGCAACQAEFRQLEAVDGALRALPPPEAPEGYHETFLSRLNMTIDEEDKETAQEVKKEDSGLLEIRKMASRDIEAQEAARKRDVEEAVAAVSVVDIPASVSQPIMIAPQAAAPRRGWIAPVAALGGLVIVAGVVFFALQGNKRQLVRAPGAPEGEPPVPAAYAPGAPPPVAASQPVAAAAGPAVAMAAPNEATPPKAAAEEPAKAAEEHRVAGEAHAGAEKEHKAHAEKPRAEPHEVARAREPKEPKAAKGHAKEAAPAKAAAAVAPLPGVPPVPVPAGKKGDALDELLRSGASARKEEKKAEPGEDLPDTLRPEQIKAGMNSVRGRVMACYDKYDISGVARISVTISRSGKVQQVKATGPFAGTATGDCVVAAVKTATFPRFKGKPLTIGYSFLLKK